jgi:hypothetical protein
MPTDSVTIHDGVPLAQAVIAVGGASEHLTWHVTSGLRSARPLAWPRIGSGRTVPGRTAWRERRLSSLLLLIEVTVDTSAAGFTEIPCYFASLQVDAAGADEFLPFLFPRVTDVTTTSFIFSVLDLGDSRLASGIARRTRAFRALGASAFADVPGRRSSTFHRSDLYVCWLGVQLNEAIGLSREVSHGE